MAKPDISIFVPLECYFTSTPGRAFSHVITLLEGLCVQNFEKIEILTISAPRNDSELERYNDLVDKDRRIRGFALARGEPLSEAFRLAMTVAEAPYICWAPSWVRLHPDYLAKLHAVATSKGSREMVFSNAHFFDNSDNFVTEFSVNPKTQISRRLPLVANICRTILMRNPSPMVHGLYTRSAFEASFSNLAFAELGPDIFTIALIKFLLRDSQFSFIDEPLIYSREVDLAEGIRQPYVLPKLLETFETSYAEHDEPQSGIELWTKGLKRELLFKETCEALLAKHEFSVCESLLIKSAINDSVYLNSLRSLRSIIEQQAAVVDREHSRLVQTLYTSLREPGADEITLIELCDGPLWSDLDSNPLYASIRAKRSLERMAKLQEIAYLAGRVCAPAESPLHELQLKVQREILSA